MDWFYWTCCFYGVFNGMANRSINGKPSTARSYRGSLVDDNMVLSINIKWIGQICFLVGSLLFGYWNIVNRLDKLESRMGESDAKIKELVNKHIEDEEQRYAKMEEEIQWYQKEFNLNPLSWKKKRDKK